MPKNAERACDEEVTPCASQSDPEVYAEGILKICKLYHRIAAHLRPESPAPISKKRIRGNHDQPRLRSLNPAKKIALAVACLTTLAVPILVGIAHAQSATPKFEVTSVKPVNKTPMEAMPNWHIGDRLVDLQATSLLSIVRLAYKVPENQITNAPDWMNSALFDIQGKVPRGSSTDHVPAMLQSLLADRFRLAVHHQNEIRPVLRNSRRHQAESEALGCHEPGSIQTSANVTPVITSAPT